MLRFTIRDVLLVTLVVAIAVAWLVDRWAWQKERENLRKETEVLEVRVRAGEAKTQAMETVVILERARNQVLQRQVETLEADSKIQSLGTGSGDR